jgi:hypothetical protein
MKSCCPEGRGCNAPGGAEPCALERLRIAAAEDRDAVLALQRWEALQRAFAHRRRDSERRFRRRAFARARDRALIGLALGGPV